RVEELVEVLRVEQRRVVAQLGAGVCKVVADRGGVRSFGQILWQGEGGNDALLLAAIRAQQDDGLEGVARSLDVRLQLEAIDVGGAAAGLDRRRALDALDADRLETVVGQRVDERAQRIVQSGGRAAAGEAGARERVLNDHGRLAFDLDLSLESGGQ